MSPLDACVQAILRDTTLTPAARALIDRHPEWAAAIETRALRAA